MPFVVFYHTTDPDGDELTCYDPWDSQHPLSKGSPDLLRLLREYLLALVQAGRYDQAEDVIKKHPENPLGYAAMGIVVQRQRDYREACRDAVYPPLAVGGVARAADWAVWVSNRTARTEIYFDEFGNPLENTAACADLDLQIQLGSLLFQRFEC